MSRWVLALVGLAVLAVASLAYVEYGPPAGKSWQTWRPDVPPPPVPNAFDTYLKAFALKKQIDARVVPNGLKAPETPKEMADWYSEGPSNVPIVQRTALYADVLKLLHEGAHQQCQFALTGRPAKQTYWGDFRCAARLLNTEAAARRRVGDLPGAVEDALDGIRIANQAMSGGGISGLLVGLACQNIALGLTLDQTVPLLSAAQCRHALKEMLALEQARPTMAQVVTDIENEQLLWLQDVALHPDRRRQVLSEAGKNLDEARSSLPVAERRGWYLEQRVNIARFRYLLTMMNDRRWHAIQQEYDEWRMQTTLPRAQQPSETARGSFLRLTDRPVEPLQRRACEGLVQLRLRELSLAVQAYLVEKGHLPPNLQVLVPEYIPRVPIDPFTNGPLKVYAKPDELAIYSVGFDNKQDRGQHPDRRVPAGRSWDEMVLIIPAKPWPSNGR